MLKYTEEYEKGIEATIEHVPDIELLKNSKILITGACGLICSALVDTLMELNVKHHFNMSVYAAGRSKEKFNDRFKHWNGQNNLSFFQYNAMEPINSKIKFDYIIHGASNANPDMYMTQPVETMLANILGVNYLMKYMISTQKARFLYISSSEVYGKKKSGAQYKEEDYSYLDILNPRACYPSSKRAAETLCAAYKEEYNIDYVVVRPGHIYGPTMTASDNRASSQFPRAVKAGENIVMKSEGSQLRSYCYVLDCTSAILTVLVKGKTGEAYNISNKNSIVTIRQMAEMFAKTSNKKLCFEIASIDESKSYNLMNNSSLCGKKLEELGWKGIYDLETGVRSTLASLV